jgi:hypothetical protein
MIDHIEEKVMLGGAQLSDWEHNFLYEVEDDGRLKGVAVRFRKFGSETRMTDRQMDCLRKIYTKIGVD